MFTIKLFFFRYLIVPIEACGSRILHNVEVKMRSVKFRANCCLLRTRDIKTSHCFRKNQYRT